MEKGRDMCGDSPTVDEEWVKGALREVVYDNGNYDEGVIRDIVGRILVFSRHIDIYCLNKNKITIEL